MGLIIVYNNESLKITSIDSDRTFINGSYLHNHILATLYDNSCDLHIEGTALGFLRLGLLRYGKLK